MYSGFTYCQNDIYLPLIESNQTINPLLDIRREVPPWCHPQHGSKTEMRLKLVTASQLAFRVVLVAVSHHPRPYVREAIRGP